MLALRRRALSRPPWERSVLDDIIAKRPWNLYVKWTRLKALLRLRLRPLQPGVTVLIVNWNTRDVTAEVIRAIQRLSPPGTRVQVIDNGSTDGSRELLRAWPGVQVKMLRWNAGHGVALDLGVCSSRTTVTVVLDSDALPLTKDWLAPAVDPVRSGEALLAGARSKRGFVHPMYLAVNTASFVRKNWSFQVHRTPGLAATEIVWGENAWDTGELLTPRVDAGRVKFVERTPNALEGLPGMTVGGVVYHHGGMSRASEGCVAPAALNEWAAACAALQESIGRFQHR